MCSFSKLSYKLILIISKNSPNEFYICATFIDILRPGCHYIIFKFWFENDTLIQVRYCHVSGTWCVLTVDLLISAFFDSA